MIKLIKKIWCKHGDYEIITRGYVPQDDKESYYTRTTAKCIKCDHLIELDKEKIKQEITHGKLLKVHHDPANLYTWFKEKRS